MTRLVIRNIFNLLLIVHVLAKDLKVTKETSMISAFRGENVTNNMSKLAEDLEVTTGTSQISALRGQDVTIPCDIANIDDKKPIRVEWKKTLENGAEKVVHDYEGGRMTAHRGGSYMDVGEILNGNAELHLPNVQISDEGEYTCSVTNTPQYASSKTDLQVSVRPDIIVTTTHHANRKYTAETETILTCKVTNFYPKTVTLRWVRYHDYPRYVVLTEGPCTTYPISNTDGTFYMASHLSFYSKQRNELTSYGCVVRHRSIQHELVSKLPEDNVLIGIIIISILGILVVVSCVLEEKMKAKKDTLTLTDLTGDEVITGDDRLIHMCRTTLTFRVINYRLPGIAISVGLRRPGQQEETIIHFDTSGCKLGLLKDHVAVTAREREHPLQPELCLSITYDKECDVSCACSLNITPSYDEDNGAELSVHVTHHSLKSPISVHRILNVVGVPPILTDIIAPEHQTPNENVTLLCIIKGFKPHTVFITWLKKDKNSQVTEVISWTPETPHQPNEKYSHHVKEETIDFSHSFFSCLTFKPTVKDDGVTYICRTFFPATQHEANKELTMRLFAFPQLDEIQKRQEAIYINEKLDLSCRIHSFYPADITVTWYVGELPLPSVTSEPIEEPSTGLYHVITNVSYTPTALDCEIFRCEVQHGAAEPKHVTWTL